MHDRVIIMQLAMCALLTVEAAFLWFVPSRAGSRALTYWARGLAIAALLCTCVGLAVAIVTAMHGAFPS